MHLRQLPGRVGVESPLAGQVVAQHSLQQAVGQLLEEIPIRLGQRLQFDDPLLGDLVREVLSGGLPPRMHQLVDEDIAFRTSGNVFSIQISSASGPTLTIPSRISRSCDRPSRRWRNRRRYFSRTS